jgi:hypothetical protein
MPPPASPQSEPPAPPAAAQGALASAVARYADRTPPSITDVRAAVAAFVADFRRRSSSPEQMVVALRACVEQHVPRRVEADERVALTQLLVRWAMEAHRLTDAGDGGRRRERAGAPAERGIG